ncbi:hypothetical protein FOZ63_016488, partial [Perkinsus olseni]
ALEAYLADKYIASLYRNMTLLSADICNYTAYAESTPPERVVSFLTSLFARFDHLSDARQVHKTSVRAFNAPDLWKSQPTLIAGTPPQITPQTTAEMTPPQVHTIGDAYVASTEPNKGVDK